MLFNRILPEEVQFVNTMSGKDAVKNLIADVYEICGEDVTTEVADAIKDIGFEYAMKSGTTIAVADITIPTRKTSILATVPKRSGKDQPGFPPWFADRTGTQ